jgi:2-pyrone-4,6-dicarboxylate lactonase
MPPLPSYTRTPSRPKLVLPAGACNAHCHIFGPNAVFPYAVPAHEAPADAPKDTLQALQRHLGLARAVIVQTVNHGFDHAVVIDAMRDDPAAYRAIALVPTDVPDTEIARLSSHGFRGARFHLTATMTGADSIDDIIRFGDRLAPHGWHLQLHIDGTTIGQSASAIGRSAVPVVIDHMGYPDASLGLDQPGFQDLLRLLEDRNTWVKVSGCERASRAEPPYDDAIPFARKLVAEFGDRAVWGTDWPHTKLAGPIPDDGLLVDLIAEMAPTPAARQALLVDNPARLYGFDQVAAER